MFDLVFESPRLRLRGLLDASACAVILPTVIGAANPFFIDATERQRGAAMRASFTDDAVAPPPVAIDDEIFTQKPKCLDRLLIGELANARDGHPVAPQHFSRRFAAADLSEHLIFFACEHIVLLFF